MSALWIFTVIGIFAVYHFLGKLFYSITSNFKSIEDLLEGDVFLWPLDLIVLIFTGICMLIIITIGFIWYVIKIPYNLNSLAKKKQKRETK